MTRVDDSIQQPPDPVRTSTAVTPLTFTPFHAAGLAFLAGGLLLAAYQGLQAFEALPNVGWVRWSHIHFVTIGAFTQLLFGMLPQLMARKLRVAGPSRRVMWTGFAALNGAFLAVWIGRSFGVTWAYDAGLVMIWLTVLALFALLFGMVLRTRPAAARDGTVALYLVSPLMFLVGLTYAFSLYTPTFAFEVPGGWWGLREGHVHANAWGFLGLAAIGTFFDVFPRLVRAPLRSQRLKNWASAFLVIGIGPLAVGPVLGLGRTVTGTGLALFAIGYGLYIANLIMTYRAGTPSALARWVLVAQAWILGPAGFAPFILFGVPLGIQERWIEMGALHFFFMGWALPVALAGLAIYARNLPNRSRPHPEPADPTGLLPYQTVPHTVVRDWMTAVWNVAVFVVGLTFFYQDAGWSPAAMATGFTALIMLWAHHLAQIVRQRRIAVRAVTR